MRYSLLFLAGSCALACAEGTNGADGSGGAPSDLGGAAGTGGESAGAATGSSTGTAGSSGGLGGAGTGGVPPAASGTGGMAGASGGKAGAGGSSGSTGAGGMSGSAGAGGVGGSSGGAGGAGGSSGGKGGVGGMGGMGGAPVVFNPVTIEAETGVVTGATGTNNAGSGWTGTGYADMYGGEGSVAWMLTVPAAGSYRVTWRYAQMATRDMQLSVNGKAVGAPIAFSLTGDWDVTWLSDIQTSVTLAAGANTLMLATNGGSGPNFDKLVIDKP